MTKNPISFGLACLFLVTNLTLAQSSPQLVSPKHAERMITARATQTLVALKRRDMRTLANLVHPGKGVRFSPYQYVNLEKKGDQVFTREQVANLMAQNKRYHWGDADGSGDPIR